MATRITVEADIDAPVAKVWEYFNAPEHIVKWGHPSDDWHTVRATNDLKVGGKFNYRMESKDGSQGFDFAGTYDEVDVNEFIAYTMSDGRKVEVMFQNEQDETHITTTFDAETENPVEMQKNGWQAILDNLTKYVEAN